MRTLICMALVFVASLSGCSAVTAGRKMLQLPGGEGTAAPSYHCTVPAEPCPRCPVAADVTDQQTKLAAQFAISHLNELSQGKKSDVALMSITEASQQVLDGTHFCIVMVACSRSAVTGVVGIHAAIHLDLRRQYQLTSYQQFTFPLPAAAATVGDAAADNSAAAEHCSAYAPRADVNGELMVVNPGQGSKVLQCAVPDNTDDPMPCAGCPASVDTRDADLVAAAAFAVQEINSNQGWASELVRIKQATSQVVAGMKYCMVLVLRENGTMPFPVQTSVWWQPWSDTAPYELLDFQM